MSEAARSVDGDYTISPVSDVLGAEVVGLDVVDLSIEPGIGHALVHAVVARDVPMIQGTALVLGLGFVLLNTLVDIATLLLDPRRRLA